MGTIQNAIDNVAMKALAATAVKDQKTNQDLQHLSQLATQKDVLIQEQQNLENEKRDLNVAKGTNKKEITTNENAQKFVEGNIKHTQQSAEDYADLYKQTGDIEAYRRQLDEESDLFDAQRDLKRLEQSKIKLELQRAKYKSQAKDLREHRATLQARQDAFNKQAEFFNKKQRIGTTIEPIGGKK